MTPVGKLLYVVIDGQVTGGNMVCLQTLDEALRRGCKAVLVSPTEGPFCDMVRERGVEVHQIDTTRSFRWRSALEMAALIRAEGVSLVHAHAPFSGTVLARLAGRIAGVPVVTHAHVRDSLSRNPLIRAYQVLLNRWTSGARRTAVIAVSEAVKREFVEQGTRPDRITVVYNGIDPASVSPEAPDHARAALGIEADRKVVVHVGRLCDSKGQHLLIRSAPRVLREFPGTLFLLVGEDLAEGGAYEQRLRTLTQGLGVAESVRFLGRRRDVMTVLSAADLLVLPSTIEGLPLVVLEAMAAGKPVVATPVGGNPELVADGETGTLIPTHDQERLAEAILRHLSDAELSTRMGERAREVVRERFSMASMMERTFEVYRSLLPVRADNAG